MSIYHFSDLPKQICPIFSFHLNFTGMNFHDGVALPPTASPFFVNTVKLAPGDMKHFKNQRFCKLGVAVHAGSLLQQRYAFDL